MPHKDTTGGRPSPGKAQHGYRNEVSWDSGQGRQPYENQPEGADVEPPGAHEMPGGDRGQHSGTHQQQDEQVKRKP